MTHNETHVKASRRRFLKIGAGAVTMAGAGAAVTAITLPPAEAANANGIDPLPLPASHPDTELIALTDEHARLEREWLALLDPMEAAESLRDDQYWRLHERERQITERQGVLRGRIVATPARTPLGALRKLSVAPEFADYRRTGPHREPYPWPAMIASVMRDLEAMAGDAS